jgi:signal transduction histidine kinase
MRVSDLIGSGWVWPATAALVVLALAGRLRTAVITGAIALIFGFGWDGFADLDHGPAWAVVHVGGETLWLVAVLAAAVAYRNTVRWRAELAHRLAQDAHERELDGRRRRAEERVEIARDLHDVGSHTLAVVGVHLNVALDAFESDPAEARESLKLAQDVRGRAMTDLKSLVDVLRDRPIDDLDGLERLVSQVRAADLSVSFNELGSRETVPAPVATAVFRVVQESLTNTVRHASASRVSVTIRYGSDDLDRVVPHGRWRSLRVTWGLASHGGHRFGAIGSDRGRSGPLGGCWGPDLPGGSRAGHTRRVDPCRMEPIGQTRARVSASRDDRRCDGFGRDRARRRREKCPR